MQIVAICSYIWKHNDTVLRTLKRTSSSNPNRKSADARFSSKGFPSFRDKFTEISVFLVVWQLLHTGLVPDLKGGMDMVIGLILVVSAVIYVMIHWDTNSKKSLYGSIGLSAAGIICLIAAVIILDSTFPDSGSVATLEAVRTLIIASVIAVPAGIMLVIITSIARKKRNEKESKT